MQIKYSKKELIELIEKYYLEKEGRDVKVSITSNSQPTGIFETNSCVTIIKVKEEIVLLGKKVQVSETLDKNTISNIIGEMLESIGYNLESLEFDQGIRQECVGCFMNEHTEYKPYFNGIELRVCKNNLVKRK